MRQVDTDADTHFQIGVNKEAEWSSPKELDLAIVDHLVQRLVVFQDFLKKNAQCQHHVVEDYDRKEHDQHPHVLRRTQGFEAQVLEP